MISGAPGVGKSYWLRNVIADLRQSKKIVDVISKTHASCQNIGCEAVTSDHWVNSHVQKGSVHCQVLVCEEVTQNNVQLWADLAISHMKGVQFICAGDWMQFSAICQNWAGSSVPDNLLENSEMILNMCSSNLFTLTENKRSDKNLFTFYTGLSDDLQSDLDPARELFPVTKRKADFTLVLGHKENCD